jgi:hypothetical protein
MLKLNCTALHCISGTIFLTPTSTGPGVPARSVAGPRGGTVVWHPGLLAFKGMTRCWTIHIMNSADSQGPDAWQVAAEGNNSVCSVGVAFNAGIGGVRMLDGTITDAVEARSLSLNPQVQAYPRGLSGSLSVYVCVWFWASGFSVCLVSAAARRWSAGY